MFVIPPLIASYCSEKHGFANMDERGMFVLSYFFYFLASTNQAMMISTFFSDSKLAGEISTFITTFTSMLGFLIFIDSVKKYKIIFYLYIDFKCIFSFLY